MDARPIFRAGLRSALTESGVEVLAEETGTALEALALIAQTLPDVVIVGSQLADQPSWQVVAQGRSLAPDCAFVLLSTHAEYPYAARALAAGAAAFMGSDIDAAHLEQVVREVAAGHRMVGSPLILAEVERLARRFEPDAGTLESELLRRLTPRERDVFYLLVRGHTAREIGRALDISRRTVEVHRTHILGKFGMASHVDLIRFAIEHRMGTDEAV